MLASSTAKGQKSRKVYVPTRVLRQITSYREIERANAIESSERQIQRALAGDEALRSRNEPVPVSIHGRVTTILDEQRLSGSRPTATHLEQYKLASGQLAEQLAKLRTLVEVDLPKLESDMEKAGAPWTPGRLPVWPEQPK